MPDNPASAPGQLTDSAFLTIVGNVPIDELEARIPAIVGFADSIQVTIRGDQRRVSSVMARLDAHMSVVSAQVSLRRPGPASGSMRGDQPVAQ